MLLKGEMVEGDTGVRGLWDESLYWHVWIGKSCFLKYLAVLFLVYTHCCARSTHGSVMEGSGLISELVIN